MTTGPYPLSHLSDPISLGKIQILLVPIHLDSQSSSSTSPSTSDPSGPKGETLTLGIYEFWTALIRRYASLRSDELVRPKVDKRRSNTFCSSSYSSSGGGGGGVEGKLRFFPSSATGGGISSSGTGGGSMSLPRGAGSGNVHLAYPSNPPAKHLYPLSLLRMGDFPLVVIGVVVDDSSGSSSGSPSTFPNGQGQADGTGVKGYAVDEDEDEEGDLGHVATPTAPTFRTEDFALPPHPHPHPQLPAKTHRRTREELFRDTLEEILPPTSPFPLVKRLLIVPPFLPRSPHSPRKHGSRNAAGADGGGQGSKGEVRFAPPEGAEGWVGGVLGEVVGELLGELGEIATALETPAGLKTLSATLLPSLTSTLPESHLENIVVSSRESTDIPGRASTSTPMSRPSSTSVDGLGGMGISLTRALTPGGRPTSIQPASLPPIQTSVSPAPPPQPASSNPFRRSTALTSPFTRTPSASSASASASSSPGPAINHITKYTSAPLTGVAGGRLLKLLGDMYLLAGMYADAIKCFDDAAEKARAVGDVLWEALAREGRAVAGIGEAWEGRDGSNAAQSFSSSPIPVEILAHYLSALACLSRAPLPYPPTILSPSPQAVSGSLTIPAPSISSPTNIGTGEGLLAYLHTGLTMRISHFNLLIWAAGGWGSIALSSLMTHTLPRSFPPPLPLHETDLHTRRKRARTLGLISAQSQITPSSILAHAEQALSPHHRAMTQIEQLTLHVEVVWLTRWLGLPRKEAAYTRELVKRLAILVVEGREESRRLGAGGFGRSKSPVSSFSAGNRDDAAAAAVGLGLGMPVPASTAKPSTHSVAVRRKESTEGNTGIIALIENICLVLGIDLLPIQSSEAIDHRFSQLSISTDEEDHSTKPHPPTRKFGWPELQVESMKEAMAISEALPDHSAIVRLALSTLNGLHGYLNPQSQATLSKMYGSALATVRRRGLGGAAGAVLWWVPGRMVLSMEIAGLAPNRLPVEHSREEIVVKQGKKDPFLYNPRLKAAEVGKTVLVANEQVDIFVTVRNPFTFDLEIQDLSILTSGVPFITSPLPLTLPASSIQTVRVVGNAPSSGTIQFRGVSLRLTDGSSKDFLLPVEDGAEKAKRDKRRSRIEGERGKVKKSGMEARYSGINFDSGSGRDGKGKGEGGQGESEGRWVECKVVEEQPLAWIKRTSLTHGTIMLYNGESSSIRITLENSSATPIDFIKLSFDDTTSRDATLAVAEGELSPEHAYEVEWDQLNRPVFTWEKEEEVYVPPGGRTTLNVRCLGKVGCTDGAIRIDYGYINRNQSGDNASDAATSPAQPQSPSNSASNGSAFYTRQITFPVLFTVYHTIECHSLDLIRLGPIDAGAASTSSSSFTGLIQNGNGNGNGNGHGDTTPRASSNSADDNLRKALQESNDEHHCLLSLCVRNVYGVPFEVALGRKSDDLESSRLVPPGATERLIIPLPRQTLSQEQLSRPIPSLSDRQYIVDKSNKSALRVKTEREMFWYREQLLSLINLQWTEPGSLRRGTLSLRGQFFHPDLLDTFRSDEMDVRVRVDSRSSSQQEQAVKTSDFVDVVVTLTNRSEHAFRPYVHLSPLPTSSSDTSWSSPSLPGSSSSSGQARRPISFNPHTHTQQAKNVLLDGPSGQLLAILEPGGTTDWTVGATFLVSGSYGFRAAVERLGVADDTLGLGLGLGQRGKGGEGDEEGKVGKVYFSPVLRVDVV